MKRRALAGAGLLLVVCTSLIAWRSCGSSRKSSASSTDSAAARTSAHGGRSRDKAPPTPASLAGRVVRASDGAGIANAVVTLAPAELMAMIVKNDAPTLLAVTDANGAWKVPSVSPGAYVVAATATGYLPGAKPKLVVNAGEQRTGIDIVLTAGGTSVRGTVTDVLGGPIERARITANPERSFDLFGHADYATTTNADGKYELTLPDGDFRLEASHDDYTRDSEVIQLAGAPLTVDFKLVPGAVIRGQVVAHDSGKPVPGALVRADGGGRGGTAIADDSGNFTLHGLSSGAIELNAIARGYASANPTPVSLGIGEQVDGVRVLVDRAYSISGRVLRKGKPSEALAGVTLGAFSIAAKAFGLALEPSAQDGSFEIVGLKPASYMLFAVGENSVPDIGKQVEVVDKDVEGVIVELDAGVTIAGRVEPATAAAHISLEPAGSIGLLNMFEAAKALLVHAETDATGAFTLKNVPAGAFNLKATTTPGPAGSLAILVANRDQTGLVVKLEPRGSIIGRVVDTNGHTVAGAHVRMVRTDDNASKQLQLGGFRNDASTAADGTFKIVGLDAGTYKLTASLTDDEQIYNRKDPKKTYKDEASVEVTASAAKTGVTLTVEAHDGVIRGVVLGPDHKGASDSWVVAHKVVEKVEGLPEQFENRRWGGSAPVLTDSDGHFTLNKLARGAYDIVVEGPKGATHGEKPGVKTGESTTIQLASLGTLTGKVTLGGAPVTKYQIECSGPDGSTERQIEAKDGAYSLERLTPGPYKCEVESDAGTAESKIDVPAGSAQLDLALTRWATLTGTVVGVLDKKPVPGVLVLAGNEYSGRNFAAALTGQVPVTDASGRFTLSRVAVGKGKLTVMPKEGFKPLGQRDYTVTEGQRLDLGTIEIVPPRVGDAGTFGMATAVTDGKLVVTSVKDGGPAAGGGVQVGDRITAINGIDIGMLKPEIASQLIASGNIGVGQQAAFTFDRAGTQLQVTLVSQKW